MIFCIISLLIFETIRSRIRTVCDTFMLVGPKTDYVNSVKLIREMTEPLYMRGQNPTEPATISVLFSGS